MSYRPATGRPLKVHNSARSSRDIIRRHLKLNGLTIGNHLAKWWNVHHVSAYRIMYDKKRRLSPQYIYAAIEGLRLDEFDAQDLLLQAAREAGWKINPDFFMKD